MTTARETVGLLRTKRTDASKLRSLPTGYNADYLHARTVAVLSATEIELKWNLPDYVTASNPDLGEKAGTRDSVDTVLVDRILIYGHVSSYAQPTDRRRRDIDSPERRRITKALLQHRAQRDAEQAEEYRQWTNAARTAWIAATPCTNHPYMRAKGEMLPECCMDVAGWQLISSIDVDGNLIPLQRIAPKPGPHGKQAKLHRTGAPTTGTFYLFSSVAAEGILNACEGTATDATFYHNIVDFAACAKDAGILLADCKTLCLRYPQADIVFAGDNARVKVGNAGRTNATVAACAIGGQIVTPIFCDLYIYGATDANYAAYVVRGRVLA